MKIVESLGVVADVERAFLQFSTLPHCVFLDSALRHAELGRYSFLAADPFDFVRIPADGTDGLRELQDRLGRFVVQTDGSLPPFQGGAAGLFSYDLKHSLESVAASPFDEFQMPAVAIGLYDVVLAIDHYRDNQAWLISQGFPETDEQSRRERAVDRLERFKELLAGPAPIAPAAASEQTIVAAELSPQFRTRGPLNLTSNFSETDYLAAVARTVEYICDGDVFQVNLSQRLLHPATRDSLSLYLQLRNCNPATFAGYFDLGDAQIVSASPERFLRVSDRRVEARPIKGTRARMTQPEADLFAGDELLESEKDRAENVMIADLLRNDISHVCSPESVQVTQLCGVEVYEYVKHLVSVVQGQLRDDQTALDLLRHAFPGGSITGAPKVRAMEIISELEPTARGAYCGALGYIGFDGTMDLNILIRTITAARGWWQLPVGGGIIAQSDPTAEYEETWHKATGMLKALG